MTWQAFILRLVVAQLLGALIGVERQWRQRMAGLRTNALVATGAALFVMLGCTIPGENSPTRIVSYVISGIGFLGGGVILREGFTVRGLNTAATIWCAAAVGCWAGWGFLPEAALGALSIIGANVVLRPLAAKINSQPLQHTEIETHYTCSIVCGNDDEARVRALLLQAVSDSRLMLQALDSEDLAGGGKVQVRAKLQMTERNGRQDRINHRRRIETGTGDRRTLYRRRRVNRRARTIGGS